MSKQDKTMKEVVADTFCNHLKMSKTDYDVFSMICPCCSGTGCQRSNKDGLKHLCPACGGKGKVRR